MSERWDMHFISIARECSRMSKDPSTRVGAVIVGPDKEIRSTGFNGFPRGIADLPQRLNNRERKLELIVHAEMNAIMNAARFGVALNGCTLHIACTNDDGLLWGGPPCSKCTIHVIQAGVVRIVSLTKKAVPSRWHEDLILAEEILREAGIEYVELPVLEV